MFFMRGLLHISKSRTYQNISLASRSTSSSRSTFRESSYIQLYRLDVGSNSPCFVTPCRLLQRQAGERKRPLTPQYKLDNVPTHFSVIYVSSLRHWIGITRLGLSSLCIGVACLSVYNLSQMALEAIPSLEGFFLLAAPPFAFSTNILLNYMARPLVTRIYYDAESDEFICVRRNFLGRLKQIKYTLHDISSLQRLGKATEETWDSVNIKIKEKQVFLLSSDFADLSYYNWHVQGRYLREKSLLAKQQLF